MNIERNAFDRRPLIVTRARSKANCRFTFGWVSKRGRAIAFNSRPSGQSRPITANWRVGISSNGTYTVSRSPQRPSLNTPRQLLVRREIDPSASPLSSDDLTQIDAWWRAANYLRSAKSTGCPSRIGLSRGWVRLLPRMGWYGFN